MGQDLVRERDVICERPLGLFWFFNAAVLLRLVADQLMYVLNSIKSKLKEHKKSFADGRKKINFADELDGLVQSNLKANVAGQVDDYVSSVLQSSRSSSMDDQNDAWLYSD